jgi:WD40 repeat protein
MNRVKVLFLAANASTHAQLALNREFRSIGAKIRAAGYRDQVELVSEWAVTLDELSGFLLHHQPQVVHFSGHGTSTGNLVVHRDVPAERELLGLPDAKTPPRPVSPADLTIGLPPEGLAGLFAEFADRVRLVVLNACYSEAQAEAIVQSIGCAVGMSRPIRDDHAVAFAAEFYQALAFGKSVQSAVNLGVARLLNEGYREAISLVRLHVRAGVDAGSLVLVGPAATTGAPANPAPRGPARLDLVPDLPKHYLTRESEIAACREKLLGPGAGAVAITAPHKTAVAVRGMGGAGKSVLAIAIANDDAVKQHFADGVFWVTVGQDGAGTEPKAKVLQAGLAARLGAPLSVSTVAEGKQYLRGLLKEKTCLIILDDVWETVDAQRLDVVEPPSRSRILITTREGRVATQLDAEEIRLDRLSPGRAVALFSEWYGRSVAGDPGALAVARECGFLPLALAVCGAMARDGASWTDIASALSHADLSFLESSGLDPTYESVLKSIAASVKHLETARPELARRYRDLAVFPADEAVPEPVVAMLWAETTGSPAYQVGLDLAALERKSLLTLEGVSPRRRVSLHDLQHDYLKGTHSELKGAHGQLLKAYQSRSAGVWARGPDDGYFFQHLPDHLRATGREEEFRTLLFDGSWLESKLRATGVVRLIADYEPFAGEEAIGLVRGALRLSAHHLARDASLLRGQLHGRLLGIESPQIERLLRSTSGPTPWLRPLTPSLTGPGGELIQTLEGHHASVNAVAVTPDGSRGVSASWDRTVKVWDLGTGALLRSLEGHADLVLAVAVTPDGCRAVSGSKDRTLKVWDLDSGTLVRSLEGHAGWVRAVAVTPDGSFAVSASNDATLKMWDLGTGTLVCSLVGHSGWVHAVALTPDGRRAVSASADGTLRVWDLGSGSLLRSLEGHSGPVYAVAVMPDGRRAVSGSDDRTLKVWDLDPGTLVRSLVGHAEVLDAVAVTPDGCRAVSGSDDRTLKVWDLDSGTLVRSLEGHADRVLAVAATPDGCRAVSGSMDGTLKVWNLGSSTTVRSFEGHADLVRAVAVTFDGFRAVSASQDGTLKVWDPRTGGLLRTLEGHAGAVHAVALTPDGRRAVSASMDRTLKVWDLGTGAQLHSLERHVHLVRSLAITPDGRRAVSASEDCALKVWDLGTGTLVGLLYGHTDTVRAVAVTPDGSRAVSASRDSTVKVWNLDSCTLVRSLEGHSGWVLSVELTPDGYRAVSGSQDSTMRVWDIERGTLVHSLEGHAAAVCAVAVTPDGSRAVSGSQDRTLKVWDLGPGALLRSLEGHSGPVYAVVLTPDGSRAVSASDDRTVRVWDLATVSQLAAFAADDPIYCCALAPFVHTIVAGDRRGRVHFLRWEGE